jgi:AAA ATPase domain
MADVLVEREGFLVSLERLLGEALGGSGRLVFLGGEAGVGKTALAAALAQAASGPVVRRGCCDNITTGEALGPILDALPELSAAVDLEAGMSRLRLFQQVRGVLSESPVLLLVEDVHWADEATLDILRFLGRRLAGIRLLILATFRSEEVGGDHPLTVVMGELAALPTEIDRAWPAAVAHALPWDLGELSWWLRLAGNSRQIPAPVAQPFALMLADDHRTAAQAAHLVGKDGRPPCLRPTAQAWRAYPRQGGRNGPAAGSHPAKIGNTPDVTPGLAGVS